MCVCVLAGRAREGVPNLPTDVKLCLKSLSPIRLEAQTYGLCTAGEAQIRRHFVDDVKQKIINRVVRFLYEINNNNTTK